MKPLRLSIALGALLALGCGIWYSEKHPPKPDSDAEVKPPVKVVSAKDDQVTKVSIVHTDGLATTLERDAHGWTITEPKKLPADSSSVQSLLTAITSLEAEQVVADKGAGAWSGYGLEPPKLRVVALLSGGKSIEIGIGNEAPTGSPVYARIAGDDRVFGVSAAVKGSLDKASTDFRDKRLLRVDTNKVAKAILDNPKNSGADTLEFGHAGADWQIVKPHASRADTYAVEDLIRAGAANFDSIVAEDENDKEAKNHNFSKPWATLTVVDAVGEHKLTVIQEKAGSADKDDKKAGKKKDPSDPGSSYVYFAKTSDMPGIYKLASESSNSLGKGRDGFRNGKIFELSFSDPDKIEVRDGDLHITLEKKPDKDKKEDKWVNANGGKQVAGEKVQSLLSQLRRLNAANYPAENAADQAKYGLDKPAVEIKLTIAGKVQRAVFAAKDPQAYAARDGDPATYEIPMADFSDVKKFIGELK